MRAFVYVRVWYLMSAPAMKHPGFLEMRTALFTAEFPQISLITSVISACICFDRVFTCTHVMHKKPRRVAIVQHLFVNGNVIFTKFITWEELRYKITNLWVWIIDSHDSDTVFDLITDMSACYRERERDWFLLKTLIMFLSLCRFYLVTQHNWWHRKTSLSMTYDPKQKYTQSLA